MGKADIKLYTFENGNFRLIAIIDDYEEASFTDSLYEAGDFTITINYNIPNALLFQRGLFVQFGSDKYRFGEIQKITDNIGEEGEGSQQRQITGKDARIIFKKRIIKSLNSEGLFEYMGAGELCIRQLVKTQCGDEAELKRQLPIVNIFPLLADAVGSTYYVSESFTNLYDALIKIATQTEIGWRVKFENNILTLECYEGTDRSSTVFFSTDYDTLRDGSFSDSSEAYANTIYVGGKGSGADRDIYEGELIENGNSPAGMNRFEAWDNQSSMTTLQEYTAEADSMLTQYGNTIEVEGDGLIKSSYIYKEHYFVGDIIKLSFSGKSANVQILSVSEAWTSSGREINFSFGKPANDLSRQLQLMMTQIQNASNKDSVTSSVKWFTIPTDTAMPKSCITYDTIGFVGNCGAGATFQLYWDNEKNGCKTYHVYIKELLGGPLTLTTGQGADLVLNAGTYVAIIYVDVEGNVTSQACTATSVISAGNNQPVTSDAVYQALQGGGSGFQIKRIADGTYDSTSATHSLATGEKFTDWDFIIPIISLYDNYQLQFNFIPKAEIEYCIGLSSGASQNEHFIASGSTGGTDRRICWGCISDTQFKVGIRNGTSSHVGHLYGFYGVKFGI